ncbi:DUF935 domain-containing protein [Thioclava sp.]|uniref:DUF935 domain-containing protein n=1 Tax=Thioclava sp. TaxID=1933450 RepID=UPI0032425978
MAQLLDQYGRPVRTQQLKQMLAEPGLTSVRQAWAGTVASGLTPQRLAGILLACDEGDLDEFLVLAEEMEERDPHYQSVLGIRKRVISGVAPTVKAASDSAQDKKIAEAVRKEIAEHEGFSDLVEDMLDALGKGYSAVEIKWARTAAQWTPESFYWRDPRFFAFDRETGRELRLRDESDPVHGIPLEPFKFITHFAKLKSGMPFRAGLARLVAFSWMCKSYTLKDWMAFIETYGLPLRLGKYDGNATAEDIKVLMRAVANVGSDAAAVIPESMQIDFVDGPSVTGDRIFENLARYIDEQISKAVLGQTMTADDGSSEAQANVHNEVRHDIARADAVAVSKRLNRDLVRPFVDLNFGVQEDYPRLMIEIAEPEDTKATLDSAVALMGVGLTLKATELRSKMKFSDPQEGDEIVGGTQAASGKAANRQVALNRDASGTDAIDEIEADMMADWQEVADGLLEAVEAAVADATSYEDLVAKLPETIRHMPSGVLVETLVKGMFKARATGDQNDG